MDSNIIDIGFQHPGPKKKILVTDDDPLIHGLISDILSDNYVVLFASTGAEALQTAAANHPDLILMDVNMPSMSGFEAARTLYANDETRRIPIVFVTGRQFDQSTIDLLKNEPNVAGIIQKPFRTKQLREAVAAALQKSVK